MIAQATNAAKNRRKKEKAKLKKAAANKEQEADPPSTGEPVVPTQIGSAATAPIPTSTKDAGGTDSYESLKRQLKSEAANLDCWGVWDEWTRRVRSRHYAV